MKSQKSFIIGNNLGFTLVELMITLAMSGIVVAAIYSAYIIQQKTYFTQGQVVEMQQNIRAGLEMMVGEIRGATYDPDGDAGSSILTATASQFAFTADLNNDGDDDDVNEQVTFCLDATPPTVGCDGNGVADDGTGSVIRNSQAIADGVQAIEIYYTLDDGSVPPTKTLTPTAAQLAKIQTVQITLLAVSSQRDPKFSNTEAYSTASSIDKGTVAPWGPYNDNLRRRLLTSSVNIRNHGLNE